MMLRVTGGGNWQGLQREWELALAAWRALADNPLWILSERMREHSAPRAKRSRDTALAIWALVLLGLYGTILSGIVLTSGWPDPDDLLRGAVFAVLCPLAFIYVLYATAQLALQGQAWLGRERGDARNVQAALLDPLLGLTLIGPREVVLAALRRLLPLVLTAAGVGALAATAVALTIASESNDFGLAVLVSPLTCAGLLIPGVLGGTLLLLLSVCLGLNSAAPLQRTAFVFLLTGHQLTGLWGGAGSLAVLGFAMADGPLLVLGGGLAAHLFLLTACWVGLRLVETTRWAGAGWLLATPVVWVLAVWVVSGMLMLYNSLAYSSEPFWAEPLMSFVFSLSGVWGSVNIFSPANFITAWSFGETGNGDDFILALPVLYLMRVGMLAVLCTIAYRAALYCAGLRLRATD